MRLANSFSIFLFFLLTSLSSFGQVFLIKGLICSNKEKLPIPYATIQLTGTWNIVDCDENGYFEITSKDESDSIAITSIGFKNLTIPVTYFKNTDSVFIEENFVKMDEVNVTSPVPRIFGIVHEKMGTSRIGVGNEVERSEITTLIEIPEEVQYYRICKIFIKGKRFSEENPIRLHLYVINENGLPGEELLKQQVIITKQDFDTKNNIITIDVKEQNIFLENSSFFVGVQWIALTKVKLYSGPEIIQTYKIPKVLSYYRQANFNNNFWWVKYKSGMQVFKDGKLPAIGAPGKGNPANMCASAEIEAFSN